MRRKVKIFFISAFAIVFIFCAILILIYHSDWAKEKHDGSLGTASGYVSLKKGETEDSIIGLYGAYFDFAGMQFDIRSLDGSVVVTVYEGKVDSFRGFQGFRNFMTKDHEIMDILLTKTGKSSYYSIPVKEGFDYAIELKLAADAESAEIEAMNYTWSNNWNSLMFDLGISKEVDIESIKHEWD